MMNSRNSTWTGANSSGQPEEHWQQAEPGNRNMHGNNVGHRVPEIAVDASTQANRGDQRPEIVIHEHQCGCLARDVRAAAPHGNPNVRRAQGGRIIDTVARHRNDFASGFEHLHEPKLLLRFRAGVDVDDLGPLRQFLVGERIQLHAKQHATRGIKAGLARNRQRGTRDDRR